MTKAVIVRQCWKAERERERETDRQTDRKRKKQRERKKQKEKRNREREREEHGKEAIKIVTRQSCRLLSRISNVASVFLSGILPQVPVWEKGPDINANCPIPPFEFTMSAVSKHMSQKDQWFGPGFYTAPSGYKMWVRVDVYGAGDGKGTHVSI